MQAATSLHSPYWPDFLQRLGLVTRPRQILSQAVISTSEGSFIFPLNHPLSPLPVKREHQLLNLSGSDTFPSLSCVALCWS